MFASIKKAIEKKQAKLACEIYNVLNNKKGEMYVPTLVLVAGSVLLGFVLINIFDELFGGVVKTGLTEAFTSIFTNVKSAISNGSPVIPTT